jgi:NAD(P)-dependent dehydrogenase (short-subunit alcohol dehydrogenase family)
MPAVFHGLPVLCGFVNKRKVLKHLCSCFYEIEKENSHMTKNSVQSIVITGSSGLIGTELCRRYLAAGFQVYGFDRTPSPISDAKFTFLKCDLAKESSIKNAFKSIKSLNAVINNAADTDLTFKPFEKVTLKDWEQGIAVNLTSYFLVARFAYPLLKKSQGSMVNISSTRHLMSEPDTIIYSASKGGIVSLTHSLAISWGPDVRVNCISPGWIAKPDEKLSARDHKQHPVGRVGLPKDIADMAFFLISDSAGFITGQDFVIDGGMTRKMIYQ